MKKIISELFVKHSMHTNQALLNDLVTLIKTEKKKAVEERDKEITRVVVKMRRRAEYINGKWLDTQENTPGYNQAISDVLIELKELTTNQVSK